MTEGFYNYCINFCKDEKIKKTAQKIKSLQTSEAKEIKEFEEKQKKNKKIFLPIGCIINIIIAIICITNNDHPAFLYCIFFINTAVFIAPYTNKHWRGLILKKISEKTAKLIREAEYSKFISLEKEYKETQDAMQEWRAEKKEKSEKVREDKYLVEVDKWINDARVISGASGSIRKCATANATFRAKEGDWALAGGAASALGGLGLGVAAAISVEAKNLQAKQEQERRRENAVKLSKLAYEADTVFGSEYDRAKRYRDMFSEVLVANVNKNDLDEFIKVCPSPLKRVDNKYCIGIKAEISLTIKKIPEIEGMPAILDGTLKFSLLNKGKKVAEEIYVAPGYGDVNYKKAGFKDGENIHVVFSDPKCLGLNLDDLTLEVEPKSMWLIQENERIFALDNSKIRSEYYDFRIRMNRHVASVLTSI